MSTTARRLVLDACFERAVTDVIGAFLSEGFRIDAVEGGDLHRRATPGHALRFARLDAGLPGSGARAPVSRATSVGPACRLLVYELTGSCTLLTVEHTGERHPSGPALASMVAARMSNALRMLVRSRAAGAGAA
jgi:hypothetical protein